MQSLTLNRRSLFGRSTRITGWEISECNEAINGFPCEAQEHVWLRALHTELDRAILACYGWGDLEPGHGFHQNERGQTRYTVSDGARREILVRLLKLNLEVAARERGKLGGTVKREGGDG